MFVCFFIWPKPVPRASVIMMKDSIIVREGFSRQKFLSRGNICTLQTPYCTHVWSVRSFFWQGYIFCNHFCIWQVFYFLTTNVQTKTTYFYSASFHLYSSHVWSANSDIKLCLKIIWNYSALSVRRFARLLVEDQFFCKQQI